jgi:hypothetical protein
VDCKAFDKICLQYAEKQLGAGKAEKQAEAEKMAGTGAEKQVCIGAEVGKEVGKAGKQTGTGAEKQAEKRAGKEGKEAVAGAGAGAGAVDAPTSEPRNPLQA